MIILHAILNISFSPLQHADMQSCTIINSNNISHSSMLQQKHFITFATVSTYLCTSQYVTETKRSWKLVRTYLKSLNEADDLTWDICFLCQDSVGLFSLVYQSFLSPISYWKDYNKKIDNMINEGIQQGKWKETYDNILKELESFQSLLYWHFKYSPHYRKMLPSSHQTARFFATAKTQKFENVNDIAIDNLKLCPITGQTEYVIISNSFYQCSKMHHCPKTRKM